VAAVPRPEALGDLVLASRGPHEAALAHLVAHRVGEGLDRFRAGDGVAVEVEERVQLVEAETPVAAEERKAGRPQ